MRLMIARVRGVYTTGITKLLLDAGFSITHPTGAIRERFRIEEVSRGEDVSIYDRKDKQGVLVVGKKAAVNTVLKVFRDELKSAIVCSFPLDLNSVYKVVVREIKRGRALVDLGVCEREMNSYPDMKVGEDILVQVFYSDLDGVQLSRQIRINGRNVSLVLNGDIRVSPKITSLKKRQALFALGKVVKPEGWGVFWKRNAARQDPSELIREIEELKKTGRDFLRRAEEAPSPSPLSSGLNAAEVIFSSMSKERFDDIRGSVVSTIRKHHLLKSDEDVYAFSVDLAEELLQSGVDEETLLEGLRKAMSKHGLSVGALMRIEHTKLDGRTRLLTPGRITEIAGDGRIIMRRFFRGGGVYDGLDVGKEDGDYALTEVREGSWFLRSSYYSKAGILKGEYYSINTPIEVLPGLVRYVDLEVDVVRWPDGRVRVIDLEKLKEAYEGDVVSKWLFDQATERAEGLKEELASAQ
jgi:Ribonuclease G/E